MPRGKHGYARRQPKPPVFQDTEQELEDMANEPEALHEALMDGRADAVAVQQTLLAKQHRREVWMVRIVSWVFGAVAGGAAMFYLTAGQVCR